VRELEKLGEEAVKAAVLETVNSLLVLDKLETVYFSDYQILD
jgi:flagellar basal body-associated protein FliL